MFKILIIYAIGGELPPSSLLDEALSGARFMPRWMLEWDDA